MLLQINIENCLQGKTGKFKRAMTNKMETNKSLTWFLSHFDWSFVYIRSEWYFAQSTALFRKCRQRNTNNSKHRPGTPKSVAMRIAFFAILFDPSGPTITNSIGWCFLSWHCQASPQILSMPASVTYEWKLARSTQIKTNFDCLSGELQSPPWQAQRCWLPTENHLFNFGANHQSRWHWHMITGRNRQHL